MSLPVLDLIFLTHASPRVPSDAERKTSLSLPPYELIMLPEDILEGGCQLLIRPSQ